jgi:hypothetical protein
MTTAPTHKMVPLVPTEEMLAAAAHAGDSDKGYGFFYPDVYRAMIEAAPASDPPPSLRDRVMEVLRSAGKALRDSYDAQYHPGDGSSEQDAAANDIASLLREMEGSDG